MVFKQTTSMSDLRAKAQQASQITKHIVIKATDLSTYFSMFLANSKGKDKTIALFQYAFELLCLCGKHSNIQGIPQMYKKQQLLDMKVYYNLKESISSARKVFRLFRFFDQIKGLAKIIKTDKPIAFKIISVFTYICSTMYYISDNILWLISIIVKSGGLDKIISKNWKYRKNFFSLCRVIAYSIILVYSMILQQKDITQQIQNLQEVEEKTMKKSSHLIGQQSRQEQFESPIKPKVAEKYFEQKLIESRRKKRFLYLQMTLSFCRTLMLIKSLKLSGHEWLDPIFVGVLGVISSILNFIKALYEKKIILSLDKKQNNIFSNKKIQSRFW